jgi:hypothetical protein
MPASPDRWIASSIANRPSPRPRRAGSIQSRFTSPVAGSAVGASTYMPAAAPSSSRSSSVPVPGAASSISAR